jgi:hypothetical protein
LIEGKDLGRPDFAAKFTARCELAGISADRLRLVNLDPKNQYLTYHDIDIALDPFPLTGGTTSCDSLWMGVPLVTLEGEMFSSRLGTGLLASIGKPEWIARDADDYVAVAARLAEDHEALDRIRMAGRPLMENSPVMNEALHAREFGTALRRMWHEWLGSARQATNSETWKQKQGTNRVDTEAGLAHGAGEQAPGAGVQVATQRAGRVSIHQHGGRSSLNHGKSARDNSKGRHDNLVARAYAERADSDLKCSRAVTDAYSVCLSAVTGPSTFETVQKLPGRGNPTALDAILYVLQFASSEQRLVDRNHGLAARHFRTRLCLSLPCRAPA